MGPKGLLWSIGDSRKILFNPIKNLGYPFLEIIEMRLLPAITITVATLISIPASAASIPGLFNTGETFAAGVTDTNYAFDGSGGTAVGTGGYGVVTPDSGFPIPPWIANTATSKWLAPTSNAAQTYDPRVDGLYKWTLSFDLTGYLPNTASFSGEWAADNGGYVELNGNLLSNAVGFGTFASFSANTGFLGGINTLDFFVLNKAQNGGNPTGLRVNFLESNVTPVPEPETYAMLLAGLGLMGTIARRRKNKQV